MVALILTLCLIGSPTICHVETPPLEDVSPMICLTQGEIAAERYMEDRPKYFLAGWKCGPREEGA